MLNYIKLGDRIRNERLKLNLSQLDLACKTNISCRNIQRIEAGESNILLDTIMKLADFFGVSVDYLLSNQVANGNGNANIMKQVEQIISPHSLERQQMAVDILNTVFTQFRNEDK